MEHQTFTLKKLIENHIFPQSIRRLRTLIQNGEKKQKGEYKGDDYIIAINTSDTGLKMGTRWVVKREEVEDWLRRKEVKK